MINFTVGPVQSDDCVKAIGAQDTPYFRTDEFSQVMLENEALVKEFAHAPEGSRTVFVTGSGTAAMEASVINTLDSNDKALVVNGGSFGARFVQLLELHGIPHTVIELERGCPLTSEDLAPYENQGYTAFLVNIHETSTGIRYNPELISEFCKRNDLYLIVDAISSFLADPLDMEEWGAGIVLTGSQKALACPPGISVVVLAPAALERVERIPMKCMYLDFGLLLENGLRGQTPFTPAVSVLLQINARLRELKERGGAVAEQERCAALAEDFRTRIAHLPFQMNLSSPSNAVTSLLTPTCDAREIFETLKDEYGIWVCPNGGDHAHDSFRVGHIGNLTVDDNIALVQAFDALVQRGIIH
ncbi:MAG: pyridoxal-phosphate-dependent aminotransferase family protein [Eggerthellaceae bacterium]